MTGRKWLGISAMCATMGLALVAWSGRVAGAQAAGVAATASQAEDGEASGDGMGRNHVETYLVEEKFDELDRIADQFRRDKTREKGGNWRLRFFYEALDAPQKTDKDSVEHLAHIEAWVKARPESITARVALATSLTRWAWVARGNGSADKVTPAMFQLFAERAQQAKSVLDGARDMRVMCPQWYSEMMTVGLALNWENAQMKETFERGVQFAPDYYYLYEQYANYLLPKWDGQGKDAAKFAKKAADHLGGDDGDEVYYRIAHTIVRRGNGNASPKDMDWQRVQRGYGIIAARYGLTRKDENELALLAYLFEDQAVAQKQFALIGDDWSRGVWRDKKIFDRARDWSRGHGLPDQRPAVSGAGAN